MTVRDFAAKFVWSATWESTQIGSYAVGVAAQSPASRQRTPGRDASPFPYPEGVAA